MINVVLIIEQRLGLISYRPVFKIHSWVPWFGLVSSIFAMFIINPAVSFISIAIVLMVYYYLSRQNLETTFEDVRSGLFVSFAEWAAKHTWGMKHMQQRAWKANLMVPVRDVNRLRGTFEFLRNIAKPKGSIKLLGIEQYSEHIKLAVDLEEVSESFREKGVFSSSTVIHASEFAQGINYGSQALQGAFFRPNIMFLNLQDHDDYEKELKPVMKESIRLEIGILLFNLHAVTLLGQRNIINVWVSDRKGNWEVGGLDIGNLDLSILTAYKLKMNWNANIRLIIVVEDPNELANAQSFLNSLKELAHLPQTLIEVHVGSFNEYVSKAPPGDLNIFGMQDTLPYDFIKSMSYKTNSSCLFVRDSGHESILA